MGIIFTFVLNAGLNLVLGLAVAAVLGPKEYGRFAVASMVAIVLSTALFDWLRLSTTRFYTELGRTSDPALRSSLNFGYLGMASVLVGVALVLLMMHVDLGLPAGILAIAALAAIANARFEFNAALARARFLDRTYAKLVIVKNVAALALMVGAGLLFKSATWVLAAVALSSVIALIPVRRPLLDAATRLVSADRKRLVALARYGVPIVAANVIYQVIVLMNRSVAAAKIGYADVGQLSLATDLSIRLLLAAGAALDVFLFQVAVRRDALQGRAAGHQQIARNMVVVTSVLVLLAVGYAVTLPQLDAVVIPMKYRSDFVPISMILIPGVLAFCIVQFALNPVFQLTGRTMPIVVSACAALAVDAILLAVLPASAGIAGFAWIHSTSLIVGFVAALVLAWRTRECRPLLRDLLGIGLAGAATALAIWPTRMIEPAWLGLFSAAGIGTPVFAAVAIAFDLAGLRKPFWSWLETRTIHIWAQSRKTHV
jgi:O-antigen/teichoic acid export membrane protein